MLPSLTRLVPTASPYERPITGMSDAQLRYTLEKTLKGANALLAMRKHLDQMSEDAAQRYMDYMRSLDGTQRDYKAKMDALQAAWDEAKQRFWEAERAVEDAIQRVIELRQELAQRGLAE